MDMSEQPEQGMLTETLRLILDGAGRSEEYEYYLHRFRAARDPFFALILPDREAVEAGGSAIQFHLNFLSRLDLFPLIGFTGPQAESMSAQLLVHDPGFHILRSGTRELPWRSGIQELTSALRALPRRSGNMVVLPDHSLLNLARASLAGVTGRIHLVRMTGGLRRESGQEVPFVTDEQPVSSVHPGDRNALTLMQSLYQQNPEHHISITSPLYLLKEIFTVKGAGTVIRKQTAVQSVAPGKIDRERLFSLFSRSFRGKLASDRFFVQTDHFYVVEEIQGVTSGKPGLNHDANYDANRGAYRGAALLIDHPCGAYLSKFAVDTLARGEGIAQAIWSRLLEEHPSVFWRSRTENSVNRWYARIADGLQRNKKWTVFWKGVRAQDIPAVIDYALNQPEDFELEEGTQ